MKSVISAVVGWSGCIRVASSWEIFVWQFLTLVLKSSSSNKKKTLKTVSLTSTLNNHHEFMTLAHNYRTQSHTKSFSDVNCNRKISISMLWLPSSAKQYKLINHACDIYLSFCTKVNMKHKQNISSAFLIWFRLEINSNNFALNTIPT